MRMFAGLIVKSGKAIFQVCRHSGIFFRDLIHLLSGILYYQFEQKTPSKSHLAMIRLHGVTGGLSTDFFCWIIRLFNRKKLLENLRLSPVFLKKRTENEINGIVQTLEKEGCYIFEEKLSSELIDYLYKLALKEPCLPCDPQKPISGKQCFDPENPSAVLYRMPVDVLLNDAVIQSMLLDEALLKISADYLSGLPKLDICGMWWSAAIKKEASVEAAQMYHFDFDRFKWLKLFIYLVDVDEHNGPHVFVKRTHRYDKRQNHLLKKNYVRLSDEEVEPIFGDQVVRILGKKGTIFLADTRALHKGLLPTVGNRLVLQLEYTSCMFGGTYNSIKNVKIHQEALKNLLIKYPEMMPLIANYQT